MKAFMVLDPRNWLVRKEARDIMFAGKSVGSDFCIWSTINLNTALLRSIFPLSLDDEDGFGLTVSLCSFRNFHKLGMKNSWSALNLTSSPWM